MSQGPPHPGEDSVSSTAAILALEARAGDHDAFARLLEGVLAPAYGLAFAMLGSRPAAEDAVQEASLRAWRKLDRLHDNLPVRPWFLAIVANECRSIRRNRWWRVTLLPGWGEVAGHSDDHEGDLDLRRAVSSLSHQDRLVLVLRFYVDLGIVDTATLMGVTPDAVKARTHRAIARLRGALTARGGSGK